MSNPTHYDALIIGTGQAGPPLAARLSEAGQRVAIVERGAFGGTCVNTGCIPTKTMVASAHAAHIARRAADFGVTLQGNVRVDMRRVKARKDEVSGASNQHVDASVHKHASVFRGHAHFVAPRTVEVNDRRISADRVFINVGARPSTRGIEGLDKVPYLTSSRMMGVDYLPRHLVIIGGSYIGLEFAQMFRRFGSEVTILERGARLLSREDEDVSSALADILTREGITLRFGAHSMSVARKYDGIEVSLDASSGEKQVWGSHLLVAAGRIPNTDDLGPDAAGIKTDERGYIVVNDALETSAKDVWALGDCNGRGAFTHTAYNDFEIVADNLLDGASRKVTDRIGAYALYIDPPLGRAGMTDDQLRASGRRVLVAKMPMSQVGRAREKGETQGFMKIAVDADSRQILGAAILGVGGDEVIHTVLSHMYAHQPYDTLRHAMHIHPTVSELLPTLLSSLAPMR